MINKNLKRKIFDRPASTYDAHAVLQNKIIELKVQVQNFVDINPKFLDVEINKKNFNLIQKTRVEIL